MFEFALWKEWSIFIYIVLAGVIIQQFLVRVVFPWGHKQVLARTSERYRSIFIGVVEWPVSFLILATAFYLGLRNTPDSGVSPVFLLHLYRSVIILCFFGMIYNLGDNSQGHLAKLLSKLGLVLDPILMNFVGSSIRVFTFILGFLTLAQEWEYNISGLVAGLGLGGLALAMASKDALSNVFGGLVILTDKPFSIGDWIQTSGLEGTVEAVTFRSTRIKTVEHGVIYVPNTNLASVPITNMSRRSKRRARFTLGLTYSTTKSQMQSCVEQIRQFLEECDDLAHDSGDVFVAFAEYGASSLDILVIYYTVAVDFAGHTMVKEKVNFAIFDIVEKAGTSIAFPSQSVYFENPLSIKNT